MSDTPTKPLTTADRTESILGALQGIQRDLDQLYTVVQDVYDQTPPLKKDALHGVLTGLAADELYDAERTLDRSMGFLRKALEHLNLARSYEQKKG